MIETVQVKRTTTQSVSLDSALQLGMDDVLAESDEEFEQATWYDVYKSCCVCTPRGWCRVSIGVVLILLCLSLFGLGLDFLGTGAKVMTGCFAGTLFASSTNPLTDVMIGILATVLLQSSGTTTSLVVSLLAAGDSLMTVQQGIFVIMGANIGTTITNTIVSLSHFHSPEQMERAFSGATVHDMFNFLTIAILLPVEVATGYLNHVTSAMARAADTESAESWSGVTKLYVSPLTHKVLIANKEVTNSIAAGGTCDAFYPINCTDPSNPTTSTCSQVGLIGCDSETGSCPAFFDPYAGQGGDQASGLVVFCIGLLLIFLATCALVYILTQMLSGIPQSVIRKATSINGYILIAIGCTLTVLFHSSSTTVSFLTPFVGMGALRLEQMYPLTLGANLGTAMAAVISAVSSDGTDGLQVALAHMMINITGVMIWYPIPVVREFPMECARRLGQYARVRQTIALYYILGAFFLLPGVFLGLATMFTTHVLGLTIGAAILTSVLGVAVLVGIHWWYRRGGRAEFYKYLQRARATANAKRTLPYEMDLVKRKIRHHQEHAGLPSLIPLTSASPSSPTPNVSVDVGTDRASVTSTSTSSSSPSAQRTKTLAVKRSIRTLAGDMEFINTALSMLYYHTGIPELESDDDDDDDNSKDVPEPEQAPQNRAEEEIASFYSFILEFPRSYRWKFVVAVGLLCWATVSLFKYGGRAASGAAGVVSTLVGLAVLSFVQMWLTPSGRRTILRNVRNHLQRHFYLRRLPKDMVVVKLGVNELLSHYCLALDEARFGDYAQVDKAPPAYRA